MATTTLPVDDDGVDILDDQTSNNDSKEYRDSNVTIEQQQHHYKDDNASIENLALYRLDYEENDDKKKDAFDAVCKQPMPENLPPRAAGGEILQPGDHVYMWCTLYQHHGIVLDAFPDGTDNDDDDERKTETPETTSENSDDSFTEGPGKTSENGSTVAAKNANTNSPSSTRSDNDNFCCGRGGSILIAEFTNAALATEEASMFTSASTAAGATSGGGVTGGFRIIREHNPHLKWHKVKYDANPLECITWRPGTCSGSSRLTTPYETLTRVQFLHECRHLIPDYHLFASNCETVAVWCTTGKWETLQGERVLQWGSLGAAAAAASMAMAPVGMALAVATSGGLALWRSQHINQQWDRTETLLNQHYKWYAMGKTPTFRFKATP